MKRRIVKKALALFSRKWNNKSMNDIKKILRQQMRAVGMTPEQLARVSGVGVVTVYRTLSGGNPTLRVLDSMLSAVGLRILALPDSPSGLPDTLVGQGRPDTPARPGGLEGPVEGPAVGLAGQEGPAGQRGQGPGVPGVQPGRTGQPGYAVRSRKPSGELHA